MSVLTIPLRPSPFRSEFESARARAVVAAPSRKPVAVFGQLWYRHSWFHIMTLNSSRFPNNGVIPREFTCEHVPEGHPHRSPPLEWSGVPDNAKSLVLIVEDIDAKDRSTGQRMSEPWVHWVLYNIPPWARELPAAVTDLPRGTLEGVDDNDEPGYHGPCPPKGDTRHRYFFRLYALNVKLSEPGGLTKAQIWKHVSKFIAQAELVGTYQRGKPIEDQFQELIG